MANLLEERLLISENRLNGQKDKLECPKCKEMISFLVYNNITVPNGVKYSNHDGIIGSKPCHNYNKKIYCEYVKYTKGDITEFKIPDRFFCQKCKDVVDFFIANNIKVPSKLKYNNHDGGVNKKNGNFHYCHPYNLFLQNQVKICKNGTININQLKNNINNFSYNHNYYYNPRFYPNITYGIPN